MAKQNSNPATTADGGEPAKGGGVNGGEETPAAATTTADGGEPVKGGGVNAVETPAQKWAAAKKAELKKISDAENAAFIAEQAAQQASEKEKAGTVEEEGEDIDDTDYSKHNTLGQMLKAKLAAAKAEATKSTPVEG